MVVVREKKTAYGAYYYLEHTFRKKGKVHKTEKYLGKSLPKNLEEMKKEFLFELYSEKWFDVFDKIKTAYGTEHRAMPVSVKQKELETFVIKFTYDTNRIEGSKLTLRETANLLENGITPSNKPISDVKEAEKHREVFFEAINYKKDLKLNSVLQWHLHLFNETKPKLAGKLREYQVAISGSRFLPPSPIEVYPLTQEFFKWYEKSKNKLHPVQLAALVHLKFVTIHPFGDGNGRISRLLMNFVLNKCGFPLLDIPYENRNSYYNALERAQVKKDESIFLNWFFKKYKKENQKYLK